MWLGDLEYKRELYRKFQKLGPQLDSCGRTLVKFFFHFTIINLYESSSPTKVVLRKLVKVIIYMDGYMYICMYYERMYASIIRLCMYVCMYVCVVPTGAWG